MHYVVDVGIEMVRIFKRRKGIHHLKIQIQINFTFDFDEPIVCPLAEHKTIMQMAFSNAECD